MKRKTLIIISTLTLIIFGLFFVRYAKSPKHFSEDGQYSYYSKRSVIDVLSRRSTMPGDGDTSGGAIYVYDEIEKKVIFQFESSWIRADMDASEFSSYDGGAFSCKSGHWFNLPRPIKKMSTVTDKKIKSGFKIILSTDFETAQKAMHFYKSSNKDRFVYNIRVPDKNLMIATLIIVEEKAADTLNITLDRVSHYRVSGNTVGYWRAPNENDIDFAEKLTKIDIENLFKEQVYNQIKRKLLLTTDDSSDPRKAFAQAEIRTISKVRCRSI